MGSHGFFSSNCLSNSDCFGLSGLILTECKAAVPGLWPASEACTRCRAGAGGGLVGCGGLVC